MRWRHGWQIVLERGDHLDARAGASIKEEDGRVIGAVRRSPGGSRSGRAKASSSPRRLPAGPCAARLFPHAPSGNEHTSPAPSGNTGDGLRLGEAVGATVDTTCPTPPPGCRCRAPVRSDGTPGTFPHFVDRSKPGVIAVNRSGRALLQRSRQLPRLRSVADPSLPEEGGEICAFFVVDHPTFRRYGLGYVKPAPLPFGPHLRSGYLFRGETPHAGRAVGVDAVQFDRTVRRSIGRPRGARTRHSGGSTAYNRSLGDPEHGPNPCVAPIERGPFYAVKVVVGDLGTFAGLTSDEHARVLSAADSRSPASMRRATMRRASWAATIPAAGSPSARP